MPISPQGYVLGGDPLSTNPFWDETEPEHVEEATEETHSTKAVSPQGYTLGGDPKNINPFWGEDEKTTWTIEAEATVDNTTGSPSVNVETDTDSTTKTKTFTFAFTGLKGADGSNGVGIQSISKTGTSGLVDTYTITFTNGTTTTFTVTNGTSGTDGVSPQVIISTITGGHRVAITDADHPTGQSFNVMDGTAGTDGITPVISATASVGTGTGTPSVSVTKSGTDAAPSFAFAFDNLKGAAGTNGKGVPTGGTAGQVLTKVDGTDYNTQWSTPQSGGGSSIIRTSSAATFFNNIYTNAYSSSNYFPISIDRIAASTVGFGYGNYVRSASSYDRDGTALEQYFNSVSAISFSVTNIQKPWLNGSRYCSRAIGRLQLTSNNVTYVYVGQFMIFWMSASAIGIVPFGAFWLSNNAMHGECNLYSGIDRFFSIQASNVTDFEGYYTVGERV